MKEDFCNFELTYLWFKWCILCVQIFVYPFLACFIAVDIIKHIKGIIYKINTQVQCMYDTFIHRFYHLLNVFQNRCNNWPRNRLPRFRNWASFYNWCQHSDTACLPWSSILISIFVSTARRSNLRFLVDIWLTSGLLTENIIFIFYLWRTKSPTGNNRTKEINPGA